MRKMIILTAMVAIAVAAVVWSIAPVAKPKFAGKYASEPVSPHEIMVKQGKDAPGRILGCVLRQISKAGTPRRA
jgi:hypothetical protein